MKSKNNLDSDSLFVIYKGNETSCAVMPTAAVLGAAVGVGGALFLTLTLLIYRYHAAQKKEAADNHYPYHHGGKGVGYSSLSNSWSTRDSWAPPASSTPSYKATSCLLEEDHGACNGRRRPLPKLYLPLTTHHQVRNSSLSVSTYRRMACYAFLKFGGLIRE